MSELVVAVKFSHLILEIKELVMLKLVCERCAGIWYLNNQDIEKESYCPFCRGKIFEYKDGIENIDTLDKAVYMIIKKRVNR